MNKLKNLLFGNLLTSIRTILSKPEHVPIDIWITSWIYPVKDYDDPESNISKGEITKFKFVESCRNQFEIGKLVCGVEDDCDCHWIHLGRDWFKLVHKSIARTC